MSKRQKGHTNRSKQSCASSKIQNNINIMATSVLPPLEPLLQSTAKRTRDIFSSCPDQGLKDDERRYVHLCIRNGFHTLNFGTKSTKAYLSVKINDEYRDFKELPQALLAQQGPVGPARPTTHLKAITAGRRLTQNRAIPKNVLNRHLSQLPLKRPR